MCPLMAPNVDCLCGRFWGRFWSNATLLRLIFDQTEAGERICYEFKVADFFAAIVENLIPIIHNQLTKVFWKYV